jgi:hypothetical protein
MARPWQDHWRVKDEPVLLNAVAIYDLNRRANSKNPIVVGPTVRIQL